MGTPTLNASAAAIAAAAAAAAAAADAAADAEIVGALVILILPLAATQGQPGQQHVWYTTKVCPSFPSTIRLQMVPQVDALRMMWCLAVTAMVVGAATPLKAVHFLPIGLRTSETLHAYAMTNCARAHESALR